MRIRPTLLLAAALSLSPLLAASAQDSNVYLDAPGLLPKKPKSGLPDVKAQPLAWPRLDPGSIFCRSEADLSRLAERRRGQPVEGPVDCQVIRVATPISIVQRKSPGLTEITTPSGSGWTDAWLPDKPPAQGR